MFDGMETRDWWLLVGAIIGPFLAVLVTRLVDVFRERGARRDAVFVSLMTTRRAVLTPEHVQALNRIEIEFARDANVLTQLRAYMTLLEEPSPTRDQPLAEQWLARRRRRAFAELVHAIAQRLHRRVDRLDILEGGYHPGGWAETEQLQLDNLRLMNGILLGRIAFPIQIGANAPASPASAAPPPGPGPQPGEEGSPFPPAPSDSH